MPSIWKGCLFTPQMTTKWLPPEALTAWFFPNALFATVIKLVQRFGRMFCLQIEDRGMSLVSKSQI